MSPNSSNVAELENPSTESEVVGNLFTFQDYSQPFEELLKEPGLDHIADLTAAYFLRPSYTNGSPAPNKLEQDHPLRLVIEGLDLDAVADPVQKHVFSLLQRVFQQEEAGNEFAVSMLDQQATGAMLVPGLMRKHGPATAYKILDKFADYFQFNDSSVSVDVFAETLGTIGEGLAFSEPQSEQQAFDRLRLAQRSAYTARKYAQKIDEKYESIKLPNNPISAEFKEFDEEFQKLVGVALVRDLGLPLEVADTVLVATEDEAFARRALKDEQTFNGYVQLCTDPDVQRLVTELLPDTKLPGRSFQDSLFQAALAKDEPLELLKQFTQVLGNSSFKEVFEQLSGQSYKERFLSSILEAEQPQVYVHQFQEALKSPEFEQLKSNADEHVFMANLGRAVNPLEYVKNLKKVTDQLEEHGVLARMRSGSEESISAADHLYQQAANDPEQYAQLIDVLAHNKRLNRLLKEPSAVLPEFARVLTGYGVDLSIFGSGASAVILDNYIPASRAVSRDQARYYVENLGSFMRDLSELQANPDVWNAYRDFLDRAGSLSVKEQTRAARVFKALDKFGLPELEATHTLDDIENALIDSFVARLTDTTIVLSNQQKERLLTRFETIAPLMTYAQRFINEPAYREQLGGLVSSVADNAYESWHRGDGSTEALKELTEQGYLPKHLTQEQYTEWITDRSASSLEEFTSSARDTAEAIRSNLQLASIDMDIIAPGYTLAADSLAPIDEGRKALGQLTGMVNTLRKQQDGSDDIGQNSLNQLEAMLSSSDNPAISAVATQLKGVSSLKETQRVVTNARAQLEQLRLLVRVANITTEEVAQGTLLSDPSKDGKQKPQQTLEAVVTELKEVLPQSLQFIPDSVQTFIRDYTSETGGIERFTVEDTIDPKVTLEIGETPLRSCQHYETGAFNAGLIGYFGPEVKILIVRNEKGGIVARSILRIMENEDSQPVLYAEPVYASVANPRVGEILKNHLQKKASIMGVPVAGSLGDKKESQKLVTQKLKMPAVYSDSGGGINYGSLSVSAR